MFNINVIIKHFCYPRCGMNSDKIQFSLSELNNLILKLYFLTLHIMNVYFFIQYL